MSGMDVVLAGVTIVATIIAAIAAAIALWQARLAADAARRAEASDRRRTTARADLGRVMDAGNRLAELLRVQRAPPSGTAIAHDELVRLFKAWDDDASATVERVDQAQSGRYHAPLGDAGRSLLPTVHERLRRLQEIQDRL